LTKPKAFAFAGSDKLFLTGKVLAEYTNATTTQFLNTQTRDWDFDLLDRLKLPKEILPDIVEAGTDLGF